MKTADSKAELDQLRAENNRQLERLAPRITKIDQLFEQERADQAAHVETMRLEQILHIETVPRKKRD